MQTLESGFIKDVMKRLITYKEMGDKIWEQLAEEDINWTPNEVSNSIAIIVAHMHGNMLSRFTNLLTEDGEKPWRERDLEFKKNYLPKEKTIALWNEGWQCVMQALQELQPADLMKTIYIRTEPIVVYDAVLRQLAHYSYHVGQMVFIAKIRRGNTWQSLSIGKGQSQKFNEQMKNKTKR